MWWLLSFALADPVDRIVAVVADTAVLQSDVDRARLLEPVDRTDVPFWTHGDRAERTVEAAMITEAAGDVAIYTPSDAAVRARMERLRQQFAERRAWDAFLAEGGWTPTTLTAALRRRMRVEAYLTRTIAPRPDQTVLFEFATRELVADLARRTRVRRIPLSR
jgi:hypothetical protein